MLQKHPNEIFGQPNIIRFLRADAGLFTMIINLLQLENYLILSVGMG